MLQILVCVDGKIYLLFKSQAWNFVLMSIRRKMNRKYVCKVGGEGGIYIFFKNPTVFFKHVRAH